MNFKINKNTYYVMCLMCLLFTLNRFESEYSATELKFQNFLIFGIGLFCLIAAVYQSIKEK